MLRSPAVALLGVLTQLVMACATEQEPSLEDAGYREDSQQASRDEAASDQGPAKKNTTSSQCKLRACPLEHTPDPDAPEVSFREDVLPALQRNCADTPCHGQREFPYLGPPIPATPPASQVHAALVGIGSNVAPELKLIAPGSPLSSFLVLKMEGCQNSAGLACTALPGWPEDKPCGETMPHGARPICDGDRELLRRWVEQGAKNN